MERWRPAAVLLPPWIPCERPALDAVKSHRSNSIFSYSIISSLHLRQGCRTKDEEQQPVGCRTQLRICSSACFLSLYGFTVKDEGNLDLFPSLGKGFKIKFYIVGNDVRCNPWPRSNPKSFVRSFVQFEGRVGFVSI
jgi:hypothetical protein